MNRVSKLCFGTLTLSPLQKNFSPREASLLMEYALSKGVNFFDTAEIYQSYPLFKEFLSRVPCREDVYISTKCYAYDEKTAKSSLELALDSMETPYVDLMMLHEQESVNTLRGHRKALEYFSFMKEKGKIRHLGMSTHYVDGVLAGADNPFIEVIHPIINKAGLGILGGTVEDMVSAIHYAKSKGKFIFAMKALAGGHLLGNYKEALEFVLDLPLDSLAIGMQSKEEIDANVESVLLGLTPKTAVIQSRQLVIDPYCIGCGHCVARCQQKALSLHQGKAVVNHEKCVLCSYCVGACQDFYIKVI